MSQPESADLGSSAQRISFLLKKLTFWAWHKADGQERSKQLLYWIMDSFRITELPADSTKSDNKTLPVRFQES